MVDHQHGFQFRSSGSKRIHLGSRCCTNLMPGRYLRLVVLQEILRGAGCCVFHAVVTVAAEEIDCPQWKLHAFLFFCFLMVFACLCFQSEGVYSRIVGCHVHHVHHSKAPHQAPWHLISHRSTRRSIFQKKPERSIGFGSSSTTPASPLRYVWELMTRGLLAYRSWVFMAAIRNSQGIHLWRLRIDFHNIFQFQVHSTLFCCFPFLWSIEYSLVLQTYYRRL